YATGDVSGSGSYVGGFAGSESPNSNAAITNCYYLDAAGPDNGLGTAKTATEMKSRGLVKQLNNGGSTFQFDINLINDGYPVLSGGETVENEIIYGTGTEEDPYLIQFASDLKQLAANVNNGETYSGKYFKMTNDIDLNPGKTITAYSTDAEQWIGIGDPFMSSEISEEFKGIFDGDNHTVSGLCRVNSVIDDIYDNYGRSGLFGQIGENGIVKNVTLSNSYIINMSGGGIACSNYGTIENCHINDDVTLDVYMNSEGGIAGDNYGTILNCSNRGYLTGVTLGGIVAYNGGLIENCYNTGDINSPNDYAGGIAAHQSSTGIIRNCYNVGNIYGGTYVSEFSGGIAGYYSSELGTVENCYTIDTALQQGNDSDIGTKKTADEMKTVAFARLLNNGGTAFQCDMKLINDGYPVLSGGFTLTQENGTETDPFLISTAEELRQFAAYVNSGFTFSGYYFKMTADIDLNPGKTITADSTDAVVWTSIGYFNDGSNPSNQFKGIFDGDNHTVSGVYNKGYDSYCGGLFGYIGENGLVKNITLKNSYIRNNVFGDIATYNYGTIENCHVNHDVYTNQGMDTGGVILTNYGTIRNCSNQADKILVGLGMGGIVCNNYGLIENCYNKGELRDDDSGVGGIASSNYTGGIIRNCYNVGYIYGEGTFGADCNMGGIVCTNYGTIENCYTIDTAIQVGKDSNIGTKLTAEEMKSSAFVTLLNNGGTAFVFDKAALNDSYPILTYQADYPVEIKVVIDNLQQNYSGMEKEIGFTAVNTSTGYSVPIENVDYTITYNGQSAKPANVGSYTVTFALTDTGKKYYTLSADSFTSGMLQISATAPSAPTVYATSGQDSKVTITWDEPENNGGVSLTGYVLYRSTDENTGFVKIADIETIDTQYVDTGLTNGTTYYYKLYAKNSVGTGASSEIVTAKPYTVPGAPSEFTAKTTSNSSVALTW
ncbi:MAG: fibronectin type III domain-containing protein, partial [Hominilimicola sp.]